ncbi:Histidyl-tRNA synthetase [Hordeum vulgare]|nr:Histidyl-tRNA synthetase [Hordeum vulgare]
MPTSQSTRLAANTSIVSLAQRTSPRIVKEPCLLRPKEKMTIKVGEALLCHFDEPLTDRDIAVIAKLTCLDNEALRIGARMARPNGAADQVVV